MPSRSPVLLLCPVVLACTVLAGFAWARAPAEQAASQAEWRRALAAQKLAAERASLLEARAGRATEAFARTAGAAAALAARIQQSEAEIAASEARLQMIARRREALQVRFAAQQAPILRLTATLQLMARRPLALALLRQGSFADTLHLQAVLASLLPEVRRRTARLRGELAAAAALQGEARETRRRQLAAQAQLREREAALASVAAHQRLALDAARGLANREQDQAMMLAEEAGDLAGLMRELAGASELRARLAALPGPILRDGGPGAAVAPPPARDGVTAGRLDYILPVAGRLLVGFGERSAGGVPSRGLTIGARMGAQVVAPAAGRVAFAGPYAGYGSIVILAHRGGWTTLVANLSRASPRVGDELLQGAPLGRAGPSRRGVTVELRRRGEPVDILTVLRSPAG